MTGNPENIVVAFDKVSFSWSGEQVLHDVSFELSFGKMHAILGPSGAGKTTLLHLMTGLLFAQKGRVFLMGEDVSKMSRSRLLALRKKMGVLFQSGALFTDLSVFDNVAFPIRHHMNLQEDLVRNMVLLKLESVGLRNIHSYDPANLSGGMTRRVALARAVAMDPDLLIYDEPFVGQDPISTGVLAKLMRQLKMGSSGTAVVVSHDVNVTLDLVDTVCLISQGRVVFKGVPSQLKASQDPLITQFIGGLAEGPVEYNHPGKTLEEDLK